MLLPNICKESCSDACSHPIRPVLISQQALRVPTAVFGQCGKLCAAVEATCPHLQKEGLCPKANKLTLLLCCCTKPSHRKPLCRLKREIKEGGTFPLPPCRLQGEVKALWLPTNCSGEVQATGGSTNTGFLFRICAGLHCLVMS